MVKINFDVLDKNLKQILLRTSIAHLADEFENNDEQQYRLFLLLGIKKFSEMFIFLDEELQIAFFKKLKENEQKQLLNSLSVNDAKSFLEGINEQERIELFKLLERKNAQAIIKLFTYSEDSAAAVSSPHFISFPETISVKEATYNTIANASENDEIDVIFFHDEEQKFVGATTIKDLISARKTTPIEHIIDRTFPFVYEDEKFTRALTLIRDYDLLMLPVLTHEKEMIGFISETDALNLMWEEQENTLRAMVKVAEDDDNLSAKATARTRMPWLLLSVVLNLVIASGLSAFESLISTYVLLVLFQPMILGMAGNIGTQSMGVTILSLNQKDIKKKKHFGRELRIGFLNSFMAGVAGFVVVYLFLLILGRDQIFLYAFIVGSSLFVAMFISAVAGVLTPLALHALKFDEKAASGPLISTINDFFALGSYFVVALLLTTLLI